MDVIKHFIVEIRKVSLRDCYIVLRVEATTPHLVNYVRKLQRIKYTDGSHFSFYGEVKNVLDIFLTYWNCVMDDAERMADKFINEMDKQILLSLVDNTIDMRIRNNAIIDKIFLPITTQKQQEIYDQMEENFKKNIMSLNEMKCTVESFDKQWKVDAFAREQFPKSILMMNEVFHVAHTFISMLLADHLTELRGSLQDLLARHRHNLRTLEEDSEQNLNDLLQKLYEKHKEQLMLSRRENRPSVEFAELSCTIAKIRNSVTENRNHEPIQRVKKEVAYFQTKLEEFDVIATNLIKLKKELDAVKRDEEEYNTMRTVGDGTGAPAPGEKHECWKNMAANFTQQRETLQEAMIEAARSLLTFFSVRGPVRMTYNDVIGRYHVDEFGHQVYHYDYDLYLLHVDCDRKYKQVKCKKFHYFDQHGRYVVREDGERDYCLAACASTYRLGDDTVLKKTTDDCGHSEKNNEECGMLVKDLTDVAILPDSKPIDITNSLKSEVVEYLWEALGAVLPAALRDVAAARARNPAHRLAHALLANKYNRTTGELKQMKEEADAYRANILQARKDAAVEEAKAWKTKLWKRRKPEEEDTQDWGAYNQYAATNDLINAANYYF